MYRKIVEFIDRWNFFKKKFWVTEYDKDNPCGDCNKTECKGCTLK